MSVPLTLRNVFWAAASLGEIVLIGYLIHRKLARFAFLAILLSLLHRRAERFGCGDL